MNTLKAELGGIEIHVPEDMIAVFNSIVNIYNKELQSHKDYFHEKLHFLQAQQNISFLQTIWHGCYFFPYQLQVGTIKDFQLDLSDLLAVGKSYYH